jgi:transducin (beta)-like 1
LLVSGSADGTARIWRFNASWAALGSPLVLRHGSSAGSGGGGGGEMRPVIVDWHPEGTAVATACQSGARIWSEAGEARQQLQHPTDVFALRFSPNGRLLASGCVDRSVNVWDVESGALRRSFVHHTERVNSVDWRSDTVLASCGADGVVLVYDLDAVSDAPAHTFRGHAHDVNSVRWSCDGSLLASCSDDFTAKLWGVGSSSPRFDLRGHTDAVYALAWSPTGPGSKNPHRGPLLATASYDKTVRLWNVEVGACVATLARHLDSVYSVAFSPDGQYVATGSLDKCVHVWSAPSGALVRTFKGDSRVFDVAWSPDGMRIAACLASGPVCVLDLSL